jgi:hypothetical protein
MSWRATAFVGVLSLTTAFPLSAQVHFALDPHSSLAWWQVKPHFRHLWGTTCPQERSWRPGELFSPGFIPKFSLEDDTVVPVYPRNLAKSVCTEAVHGDVSVADTTGWRGVKGTVVIQADDLVTGLNFRDTYTRERILETVAYPDIRFQIDSVINVHPGDTLRADAVGVIEIHGVRRAATIPIKSWHELLGRRVTGKLEMPASDLTDVFRLSPYALALGVRTDIWKRFFLGIDAVLVPASGTAYKPSQ